MPFTYSCFISYRVGQNILERFVHELHDRLSKELALVVDEPVFADFNRLRPGERFDQQVAKALCQSLTMIVVYTPSYFSESSLFCAREFQAMRQLEAHRLAVIGDDAKGRGFIIPAVLRGGQFMPPDLRRYHHVDFERYLSVSGFGPRPFVKSIRSIAEFIHGWSRTVRTLDTDLWANCDDFRLPSEKEVRLWLADVVVSPPAFPK